MPTISTNQSLPRDSMLTAIAPCIWGSTYIVTTEFLPADRPLTAAVIRILPIGIIMLTLTSALPKGWWWKLSVLGLLNIGIFNALLFVAAYRLPGGVAATVSAIQPLIVLVLAWRSQQTEHIWQTWLAAIGGLIGVSLLVLGSSIQFDMVGIIAALIGAFSMASGVLLTKQWQIPFPVVTLTAWQLIFGGILLLPLMVFFEEPIHALTLSNLIGYVYLGVVGTGLTYILWFRGVQRLSAPSVSLLGFLSPIVATLLGYVFLHQNLSFTQFMGGIIVLGSIWLGQHQQRSAM